MNAASWLDSFSAADRWRDLALTHGPKIATWVLALAIGVQAAVIVTDLTGGAPVPDAASSAPMGTAGSRQRTDIAAITAANLFGSAQVQAPQLDAANAPRTNMPLVLTGIVAAEDPQAGLAILGESPTTTKVYAVGDPVPGGARLHSVHTDRVLLDRNGKVEALVLPRQLSSTVSAPPPPPVAATMSDDTVERVRRLVNEEPGVLADIMRPQPVYAQGKQRGFRVYPGRNRQAFTRLGLRPGDLVTAINGTPLDDPNRGQEIFQTLATASEARVTVIRNGRQQDLNFNMAQVALEAEQLVGAEPGEADAEAGVPPAGEPPADPGSE